MLEHSWKPFFPYEGNWPSKLQVKLCLNLVGLTAAFYPPRERETRHLPSAHHF